ncbi:alpha-mannosidase 2 [Microcaecilia unicolor]|uniref:Alpha-mannosidase n=1 Tax=Microcaecilia unicolor TaxID=1415580 RepID=A0A6P7XA08_9AMPH|nr:alpha-mannosidase 2 [Microcaecilia unicolor]
MKLSRQFTVIGSAIFCVVIFSLYLMLDRGHLDQLQGPRREAAFHKGQLSVLQEKIDHLERLLAENNEIISNIRDSVINLSESVKDGQKIPENINFSQESDSHLMPSVPVLLPADPKDCLFAGKSGNQVSDVQMLDVYDILPFDNPDGGVWKQGFDITYDEKEMNNELLQVFVVPHSHNDPGWLKTFDEYFHDQTQHILNNMVVKLQENGKRKFIWSEISYFSKWWDGIDIQKREAVKRLIELGQFEIVTGGWVMPDEASSHYFSLIDQLIEGHQWLEKNLGVKPKAGWAIDPFGHSPTMAYLLKRSGLSNMLIQRVHYSVKKYFATQKTLEFYWRQNWGWDSNTDILCHMMPFYSYDVPHTCGPDPKICCQFDFKRLPGGRVSCPWRVPPEAIHAGNVQHRALMILDQYRKKSKLFRTNVLLAPLGDDFRYSESSEWDQQYQNYQKLFDYMNSHPELHVKAQFGTLSDYFEALQKADTLNKRNNKPSFPVLSGDFFTYADRDDHYWSGYFTSRPFYKRLERVMESHLRAAEILYSLALVKSKKMRTFPSAEHYKLLVEARRNFGLFQHHDAITGTAKDWVVVDYGTRLFHSLMNLKRILIDSAHILILKDGENTYSYNPSSPFFNMDDVQPSQDALPHKTVIKISMRPRYLVIYNPTEQDRFSVVSIYVTTPKVKVLSASGKPIMAQVNAVWDGSTTVSHESYQLSFLAHVTALGLGVYQLLETLSSDTNLSDYSMYTHGRDVVRVTPDRMFKIQEIQSTVNEITIENIYLKLWFSGISGLMEKMKIKDDDKIYQTKVDFIWYGTTSKADKSGAYLFLPDGEAKPYVFTEPPVIRVSHGSIFSEVTCFFLHITHTVRLYNVQGLEGQSLEIANTVDIRGEYNREIAMRITSTVYSQNRFYTDLNGYQIQPRQTMSKLPLQANVYPMTSMIYIQDNAVRLTLLSAQSLGVASLKNGQLEVFMDRRLMQDDNRGLGQGIQDNKITANLFKLLLERRHDTDKKEDKFISYPSLLSHITSSFLNQPFISMAASSDLNVPQLLNAFSPLTSPLPCDVHMLNLRTIQSKVDSAPSDEAALILHRRGFDCRFSNKDMGLFCSTTQGKILVHKLFSQLNIESLVPASLSLMHASPDASNTSEIHMNPMEISAFRIKLR